MTNEQRASKTTGDAAALRAANLVLEARLIEAAGAQRDLAKVRGMLQDLDNAVDVACADLQALSRTAGLLMSARTGYPVHDRQHREAGFLILEQLLPALVAGLAKRVTGDSRAHGAEVMPDHEREVLTPLVPGVGGAGFEPDHGHRSAQPFPLETTAHTANRSEEVPA